VLLVTHSLNLVGRFCDEALWLDAGHVRGTGDPRHVVDDYITDVAKGEDRQLAADDARSREAVAVGHAGPERGVSDGPAGRAGIASAADPLQPGGDASAPPDMFKATEGRWGSREVEITDVALFGEDGAQAHVFQSGGRVAVRLKVRAARPTGDFVFGLGIFNAEGTCCYGTNTDLEDLRPEAIDGDGEVTFTIERLDLVEGSYKLDVAVHRHDGYPYDYHRLLYSFRVKSRTKDVGIYRPVHHWEFSGNVRFKP
jgi:hypothetical protein